MLLNKFHAFSRLRMKHANIQGVLCFQVLGGKPVKMTQMCEICVHVVVVVVQVQWTNTYQLCWHK